jgi:uncharacterized protein (TIGR02145 family)
MRKKVNGKRVGSKITLFVSAVFFLAVSFYSCQKDEMILGSENIELKSSAISEIYLDFPDVVAVGEDFDITFSSSCGRIMIERGFLAELDEYGEIINKVYTGLDCATENLMWESVGEDVFESCQGATITENLTEPGTYVYRAKLNFKKVKNSECTDCGTFTGNLYECFMITAAEGNGNEGTFTDARDGKVYKWVKIGNQIWMAENLAYLPVSGSYAYNNNEANVPIYGRLYTRIAALTAAPVGWHLPSIAEWETLISYISENSGLYGPVAKALASKTLWQEFPISTYPYPGSNPGLNNSSGFNGFPAGSYDDYSGYQSEKIRTEWWSSDAGDPYNSLPNCVALLYDKPDVFKHYNSGINGYSIRCIKNAE